MGLVESDEFVESAQAHGGMLGATTMGTVGTKGMLGFGDPQEPFVKSARAPRSVPGPHRSSLVGIMGSGTFYEGQNGGGGYCP